MSQSLSLAAMIAGQRPGHALSREFYADPALFRHDLDRLILRHWSCVGHASMAAAPGDFFTAEIGGESLIVARGQDGELRTLVNVCRHRGSRVCTEARGHVRGGAFVCPYHAWSYGLDGTLRTARHMDGGFDRAANGLATLHTRVIEGLVFVSFAAEPPGFAHVEAVLAASASSYGWAEAKVAHRELYRVDANWKLAVENYNECYHCGPAHTEYARLHVNARLEAMDEATRRRLAERTRAAGAEIAEIDRWFLEEAPGQEPSDSLRTALLDGFVSGSDDGREVAPLMGRFRDYDGGATFFDVGPFSNFLAYPDHGLIYRFIPQSVQTTDMEVIWLVRGDARQGIDYDLDRLIWLWTVTSIADKRIIELNQQGVNSRYYRPGPYAPMEQPVRRFIDWYLREIG
jgi:Rieske 2Fe-2S family protein